VGYIKLTFRITQEGKYYVSECLELGTSSFGDSPEEAGANIVEATELYLNTLEELGECTQVLKHKGILVREDRFPDVRALFQPNAHSSSFIAQLPVSACA
jgi:predicted RNase H-like HicB family nuclease